MEAEPETTGIDSFFGHAAPTLVQEIGSDGSETSLMPLGAKRHLDEDAGALKKHHRHKRRKTPQEQLQEAYRRQEEESAAAAAMEAEAPPASADYDDSEGAGILHDLMSDAGPAMPVLPPGPDAKITYRAIPLPSVKARKEARLKAFLDAGCYATGYVCDVCEVMALGDPQAGVRAEGAFLFFRTQHAWPDHSQERRSCASTTSACTTRARWTSCGRT